MTSWLDEEYFCRAEGNIVASLEQELVRNQDDLVRDQVELAREEVEEMEKGEEDMLLNDPATGHDFVSCSGTLLFNSHGIDDDI
jgi:ATP-dependent protease HslVU (ClpYQ) peptidase subunit